MKYSKILLVFAVVILMAGSSTAAPMSFGHGNLRTTLVKMFTEEEPQASAGLGKDIMADVTKSITGHVRSATLARICINMTYMIDGHVGDLLANYISEAESVSAADAKRAVEEGLALGVHVDALFDALKKSHAQLAPKGKRAEVVAYFRSTINDAIDRHINESTEVTATTVEQIRREIAGPLADKLEGSFVALKRSGIAQ